MFIELTSAAGNKFILNIKHIIEVWTRDKDTMVTTVGDLEFQVKESYEEVVRRLNDVVLH